MADATGATPGGGFLAELKRRRVIRVLVLYAIAGWIVIEVVARSLYIGAQNLWHVGEQKKAIDLAEQALGQGQDEPMVLYNVACLYTTQGNTQRALDLLEEAVRRGFGDRAWMETDSDLEPLRQEARFQALLAGIH